MEIDKFLEEAKKIYQEIRTGKMTDMKGIELKRAELSNGIWLAHKNEAGDQLITVNILVEPLSISGD